MSKDVEGQASNEPVNSQADVGAMTPAELYTRRAKPAQADPPKEEPSAPQEQTAVEGHAEQQPDAQPETPKDDKKAKPKPEKREKPAEKADAPPEFRRIKLHNGAEVDVPAQYAEQVEDAVQTARQFIPLQRKHQEMLEALAAQQSRPPQTEQTPVAPEDAKKAFSEAMAPTVKRLVDGGFLSADTVEINPDVANVIALLVQRQAHAEAFQQQAMGFYNTAVVPLFQGAAEARQRAAAEGALAALDTRIAGLSSRPHEAFKSLGEPDTREGFIRYLAQYVNPTAQQIEDEEFLAKQFVAYQGDAILATVAELSAQRQRQAGVDARGRGGEPSGARVAKPAQAEGRFPDITSYFRELRGGG